MTSKTNKRRRFPKRHYVQLMAAVLYNCNFRGFADGKIYKGDTKGLCVPGLNCYSCPGAAASCPLGSLQSALVGSRYRIPYYILGTILLFGLFLGRFICGFLCPFGLIQDLLHKIPTPKIGKSRVTRLLSLFKYAVLFVFVLIIPLWKLAPGFCKYICPAGTFEAGIPLVFKNPVLRELTGRLFTWKVFLLCVILLLCIFCFRAFCRFVCPLGAVYSFFQPVAIFGIRVYPDRCTNCGACVHACPMDIKKVRDRECIHCGQCISSCPEGAIHYGFKDSVKGSLEEAAASVLGPSEHASAPAGTAAASGKRTFGSRKTILLVVRLVLFVLGVTLLVAGILGGGFRDVLNKAIRICHECIGIG